MNESHDTARRRRALMDRLFPGGVPKLWCPPLTHYDAYGAPDRARIAAHLRSIAPYAKGLLVPGSTGDGWEMDDHQQRRLLELVLELSSQLDLQVLIGALRADAEQERRVIADALGWLRGRTGLEDDCDAMTAAGVCGFTVCPHTGRDLSQEEIHDGLAAILELGAPTALYQLPQVTLNEMTPETVAELAGRYANFYLLKDTSGADRVAVSGLDFGGLHLVRGAEGDYNLWLKAGGGPYDGFLLSTANCFARQLHRMIEHIERGRVDEARSEIAPVEKVVARTFDLVADLPEGNAFANANKAIDHFLAHGPEATRLPPPRLYAGSRLPAAVIEAIGRVLADCGLMPRRGYLHDA
ncbi:MAG: dihydrodipicolinate synthase family protein [Planctomycetota bacterium]|jgi:dihydrodipicolinate synthase/N-acetylneuraminate lyase